MPNFRLIRNSLVKTDNGEYTFPHDAPPALYALLRDLEVPRDKYTVCNETMVEIQSDWTVQGKHAGWCQVATMEASVYELARYIVLLCKEENEKIKAIKLMRLLARLDGNGMGLREAKEFVEWLWANPSDGLLPS